MTSLNKNFLSALIEKQKREDGRELMDYRNIEVEINPIGRANGSARVKLGETEVIVGVKLGVGTPFPDSPADGVLMVNAELFPIGDPNFELGPPRFNSIELARVVDRGIRESKAIQTDKLVIQEKEKVWMVFVDIYPINNAGNLFDAAGLAAAIALKNAVFPKYDEKEERVLHKEFTKDKLPLNEIPLLTTFGKLNNELFVDPTIREQEALDSRLSIATLADGTITAMQKGGTGTMTEQELNSLIATSIKKSKELRKFVK